MSSSSPARAFFLLSALGVAALAAWKLGAPDKTRAPAEENPAPAMSSTESAQDYTGRKDSKCCDKAPSKAALLQNP